MNTESRELSGANYEDASSTHTNDVSKVLIGALAGAAVGSLIMGSFTQKGIEIRNHIGEGSKNMANNLKDRISDMAATISDKIEDLKESAADLIEKGKQKVGISSGNNDYTGNPSYMGTTAYSSDAVEVDDSGPGSKILLGALIVSVAGTLVWSFATEKGNETRRRIARGSRNMASNFKDKVSNVAGDIADGISNVYESAKEGAVDLLEQQKQKSNTSLGSTSYGSSMGVDNW